MQSLSTKAADEPNSWVHHNLGDLIESMQIAIVATAKAGQPFIPNKKHNLVVELMTEESNVQVLEEQVEE